MRNLGVKIGHSVCDTSPHTAYDRGYVRAQVRTAATAMIGMTAFRAISHEFACLAVRHDGSGNTTARRQGKSAAFGRAQVVGRIGVFCHLVAPLLALPSETPSISARFFFFKQKTAYEITV